MNATKTWNPLAELRTQLHGTLLEPQDTGFAEAVQGWSLGHQHHPSVVLIAQQSSDVVVAVQFARVQRLPIAV